MEIITTTQDAKTYLIERRTINIKDIMDPEMWRKAYQTVHEYINAHGLTVLGPGSALYFSMDPKTGMTDFGIGNTVEGANDVNHPSLSLVTVPKSTVATATVYGEYTQLRDAHRKMAQYCTEHHLTTIMPVIEEYMVTGMDTSDPKDWKTNLYYPYQEQAVDGPMNETFR